MKFFKYLIYTTLLFIVGYMSIAHILIFFPKRDKIPNSLKNRTLYIYYDAMHSDIIIDINRSQINWKKFFPKLLNDKHIGYLEFGWGDRETYLNTPSWSNLKLSTALKALFINSPSLIHVIYYNNIDDFSHIKKINITDTQYMEVERKILESFGDRVTFVSHGYWGIDNFYQSIYQYNIFNTCNRWTGDILRESNITMSYWTPLSYMVIASMP